MQHLVKLVRTAAAEVLNSPAPPIDIGTLKWSGEFGDLIGLGLCSGYRVEFERLCKQVFGGLGNPVPVPAGFLVGDPGKCERLVRLP